jgi:hypothetical protein
VLSCWPPNWSGQEADMTRYLGLAALATVYSVCATAAISAAPAPAVADHFTVVGCVANASDGTFVLTPADRQRSQSGTNSSKASTPVGHAPADLSGAGTAGSNTAKGSTPIRSASLTSDASTGYASVMTSKGSTPIRRVRAVTYTLIAEASELASSLASAVGRMVEVAGTLQSADQVKVDTLKTLSSSCSK